MGADERALLASEAPSAAKGAPSLRALLRRPAVLAMIAAHFATTWTLYVLLSWLPSYFRDVLHLGMSDAGVVSAAPWIAMFVTTHLAAHIADRRVARGASVTATRKWMQAIALLGSSAFLLATRDVRSPAIALVLLCAATGALGFAWSGYAPNSLELAPEHAGVLFGVSNTVATIPGIVGVAVTGWLVDATGTYAAAFVMTAAVSVACMAIYAFAFDARPLRG